MLKLASSLKLLEEVRPGEVLRKERTLSHQKAISFGANLETLRRYKESA